MPSQKDQQAMASLFARHMDAELAGDLETTLATMTDNPHLVNVPWVHDRIVGDDLGGGDSLGV